MSTLSNAAEPAEALVTDADVVEEAHEHPSDWQYVKIFLVLIFLTGLEVFTYFESVHNLGDGAIVAGLVFLMLVKFALVVLWFMHLKFDSPLFKRVFVAGLVLATAVYLVMLLTFRYWA